MSLAPAVMRRIMRELSELQTNPPEGVRVVTSEDNMLDVTGIIEGPEGTPYAGGYFRVKFNFTEEFPSAPPKCRFLTKIFHPNVSGAGEICVNTLKKDWQSSYGIGHILVTVKCLLIYPNPESALDEEAGKLLLENYESYCERARLITSVHATPRIRPVEFNTPSEAVAGSSSASTSKLPPAKQPSSSSAASPPIAAAAAAPKLASSPPSPLSQPLQSSAANTCAVALSSDKGTGKERLTSPSPLGTADANVAGMGTTHAGSKAVKRAAVGGGIEKRKKALKRL